MSFLFFLLLSLNEKMSEADQAYKIHQEDFQFIPKPIGSISIEETVNQYAENYKFKYEQQQFKLVSDDVITYKVVKQHHTVNQPYYLFGKESTQLNEIVIDINTAERQKLKVGDSFQFLNKNYIISGIAGFPGQIQPNMNLKGFGSYHPDRAVLVELTDENFAQIAAEDKTYYSGIWLDKAIDLKLDAEKFYLIKYADDNVEINSLSLKISMNQMIAGISIGVLMTIVLVMLAMLIYRIIKENQEIFGVLKGIGYTNFHIISSFLPINILLLIPIIIGKGISVLALRELFVFLNQDVILPYFASTHNWLFFGIVLLSFLFITSLFSMLLIAIMIRKSPVVLIHGIQNDKNGWLKRIVLKATTRKNILLNLRNKFVFRNPFVLGLMIFTGFALAVQLLLSFAMFQFPKLIVDAYEKQFTHKYDISFTEKLHMDSSDDYIAYENMLFSFDYNGKQEEVELYVLQLGESNNLIRFNDYSTGVNMTFQLGEGIIISKWFAHKYDLRVGDHLVLSQTDLATPLMISGIHQGLQGNEAYTTVSYYSSVFNSNIDKFSGIYSDTLTHASFNDNQVSTVIEFEETLLAVKHSTSQYKWMGLFLLIIGIGLSIILMSIALYIMLQNNKHEILLFKAMGYLNSEIFTICINGYLNPLLLGLSIAIPYYLLLEKLLFGMISRGSHFYIPMEINVINFVILLLSTVLFFYFISFFFMRNISKDNNFIKLMNN